MKTFGEFIQEKRKEKKLTLMEVAEKLKISFTYLADLEKGRKLPPNSTKEERKETLTKFKEALDLTEEEYQELIELADQELIERGHISNDMSEYMSETPMATIAMRRAKNKNITNEDWKKIINHIEELTGEDDV